MEAAILLLINALTKKEILTFSDATLLFKLIEKIKESLHKERFCVHTTHRCLYRDGACKVLENKGENWTLEDICSCQFREKIDENEE